MKIAVYNAHWNTAGGGERLAGFIAQCLARDHDVSILSHEPFDAYTLEERLDLDLSGVSAHVIPEPGNEYLPDATVSHDLLVNCSFGSDAPSGATRGIYVVLFPGLAADPPTAGLDVIEGFHHPEHSMRWGEYRWTSGAGRLRVSASAGAKVSVHLALGEWRGRGVPHTDVEVEVDGDVLHHVRVGASKQRPVRVPLCIEGRGHESPVDIVIRSETFCPAMMNGSDDSRDLGVIMLSARMGPLTSKPPRVTLPPPVMNGATRQDFLDSYHRIVSISAYTQNWVRQLWGRESVVLYPPVSPHLPGDKDKVIVSVARFFDHTRGHAKKQLETIEAFRRLVEGGLKGWEYHLVGGYSELDRAFFERVRAEAQGLPIHLHPNASGAILHKLYARASVLWHGTGLGEKEHRTPYRFEHFGIATVEGMSAGAVPIVVGGGGQKEIVEDGVNGFHVRNTRELAKRTLALTEDDDLRHRMADAARVRAKDFAPGRFACKLNEVVEATLADR